MFKHHDNIIYWPLIIVLMCFCLISCVTLKLGLPYYASKAGASTYFLKQAIFFVIGAIAMIAIYKFGSDRIYSGMWIIYGVLMFSLVLLALQHFAYTHFGVRFVPFAGFHGGATSWYDFPGFSFQPSEFMKIIMVVCMAQVIDKHNSEYLVHDYHNDALLIGKVLGVALPPCILVYLQNDAGVTLIMLASVLFILFSSGIKKGWYIVGGIAALVILLIMIYLFVFQHSVFTSLITGHKLSRFYGWLDPEGTYSDQGFQLYNAQMAYGTSGLLGHGYSDVIIALQEPQTDFIFALITLGFGLLGGGFVIILTLALDFLILHAGLQAPSFRDKYFVAGLFGLMIFQQVWNIGMVLGLLPITGITLPFLSYGGSSILSYMLAMGIILDIHHQTFVLAGKNRYN